MNISLTPTLEKFINDKVAAGLYNSASEVIREAVRLLMSKDTVSQERLIMLNRDIEEGLNDPVSFDGHETMQKLMDKYE